jgi:hypothetical protein
VSVVIPSRNRPALARLAVEVALANLPADGEVVFADNSDLPLASLAPHPQLKVVRADRILSMPDNWEQAVAAAQGRWIMVMSDKDRLIPGALARLLGLVGSEHDAVIYARSTFIQNVAAGREQDHAALLESSGVLARSSLPLHMEARSSAQALVDWYSSFSYRGQGPMLYTALVKREVIERAVARTGRFFLGAAPDVASGLQIAANSTSYLQTNLPGTLAHIPTRELHRWSNGISLMHTGALSKQFLKEFGRSSPLGALPFTGLSVIMQTLIEFRRAVPDAAGHLTPPWEGYAEEAAAEIERSQGSALKLPRLWRLVRATQSEGPRLRPALAVAKVLARSRTGFLHRPLRRALKDLLPAGLAPRDPPADPALAKESEHVGLMAALEAMARESAAVLPGEGASGAAAQAGIYAPA